MIASIVTSTLPMDLITFFIDLLLHLDRHLELLLAQYGTWLYAILFLIVFCETGLVVMPFLPGDSLLFMAGALAAGGGLEVSALIPALFAAAVLGDTLNYGIGRRFGSAIARREHSRFFNRRAYESTHAFYERHGGKTVVIARFLPLIRTFAPFVAGIAAMPYLRFAAFNVLGAALWVGPLVMLGYWFGNLPVVKDNLSVVVIGIIIVSLAPVVIGWARQHAASSSAT